MIIGAFVVVLLGIGAAVYAAGFMVPPHAPVQNVETLSKWQLVAHNIRFNDTNPTIYVPLNVPVTLTITNDDGMPHTWDIDALNLHSGIIGPGETKSVTFTVNTAGTYDYYCSIHPGLMDGKLVASSGTS